MHGWVEKRRLRAWTKGGEMASMRGLAEAASEWGGCGRDAFELDLPSETPLGRLTGRLKNQSLVARTIEKQIIPHLLQAHRSTGLQLFQGSDQVTHPSVQEIADFSHILISHDVVAASEFVENICEKWLSLETIFLDLFAPSARYIGKLWDEDKCNFADVTIALSRLQQLLRELSGAFDAEGAVAPCGRSALLVGSPGDQHTFGLFVLQEFFRRAGWGVRGGPWVLPTSSWASFEAALSTSLACR